MKQHANVDNLDHSGWTWFSWTDNGTAFASRNLPITVGDLSNCSLCNHALRYVNVFFDPRSGEYYPVGETCSVFVESKMPNDEFLFIQKVRSARKVNTKRGERWTLKLDLPVGFWDLWREMKNEGTKPDWLSVSKYKNAWSITIWAEKEEQISRRYRSFLNL